MKNLFFVFFLSVLTPSAFSQDNSERFKHPLERDVQSEIFPLPGPIETNPTSSVFFNINISQNSAPQNEPSVCISRKDPNKVVAAWRDFRYGIDPNANRRVGYSYSTNAGLTWSPSQILDSTLLPNLTRNSDPVVTVDTAGNFYIAVISIPFSGGNLTLAIYKSTNQGVTFPQAFICSQTGTEDKEWIATDLTPSSPFVNTLYISWTSFSLGGIRLTKSTNSGVNWSTPVAISDVSGSVQGSNICVSRNGQVSVCWLNSGAGAEVKFDRSTNGGATFGTDLTIASGTFPSGLPNNVGTFPFIAVDNTTGARSGWLYVVFADNRNGDCDVFFSRSTNAGVNWSAPQRVNNDPITNGKIQYWPAIAVSDNGNLAIIYMDTRNTPNNTIIEAWVARSTNGGVTFNNEAVSTEQSPTAIPGSNVRFGDYIDIDYVGQNIVPVWTDERAGGFNQEIYTAEITELLGIESTTNIPNEFSLGQNYPNPFNPKTVISFQLAVNSFTSLKVYDLLAREVATLVNEQLKPGTYEVDWDGSKFASGVYYYKLTAGDYTETKKMILLK